MASTSVGRRPARRGAHSGPNLRLWGLRVGSRPEPVEPRPVHPPPEARTLVSHGPRGPQLVVARLGRQRRHAAEAPRSGRLRGSANQPTRSRWSVLRSSFTASRPNGRLATLREDANQAPGARRQLKLGKRQCFNRARRDYRTLLPVSTLPDIRPISTKSGVFPDCAGFGALALGSICFPRIDIQLWEQ